MSAVFECGDGWVAAAVQRGRERLESARARAREEREHVIARAGRAPIAAE